MFSEELIKIKDQRIESDVHGYRAIHVMVKVDGRLAEIQIRTHWQDRWAQVVERLDASFTDVTLAMPGFRTLEEVREQIDLKHGIGPPATLNWLRELSDEFRNADLGRAFTVPQATRAHPEDRAREYALMRAERLRGIARDPEYDARLGEALLSVRAGIMST